MWHFYDNITLIMMMMMVVVVVVFNVYITRLIAYITYTLIKVSNYGGTDMMLHCCHLFV